ncbi:MAG: hypothetical protein KGI27_13365 [Thaumarchaeota archaeon]|nr:hypothetical protein [Nitrososphaerota archaeon]
MKKQIYLEPQQVPTQLRSLFGYTGRAYQADICESFTIPADAGLWSGGTRERFLLVRIVDGASLPIVDELSAPWSPGRKSCTVKLEPGVMVARHSMFCGKDMGITFYMLAGDVTPMLPAPVDLSHLENMVLKYTAERKSSYNGQDRYAMAKDDSRWEKSDTTFPTREQWDAAKAALIARGMLNKAGAITVAGRNAYKR